MDQYKASTSSADNCWRRRRVLWLYRAEATAGGKTPIWPWLRHSGILSVPRAVALARPEERDNWAWVCSLSHPPGKERRRL